eukprot:479638_1
MSSSLLKPIKLSYWLVAPDLLFKLGFRHAVLFCILFATPSIFNSIKAAIRWLKFTTFLRIVNGKEWVKKYQTLHQKTQTECQSYQEFAKVSSKMDEMNGLYAWRMTKYSKFYSYNTIQQDLFQLSKIRTKCDQYMQHKYQHNFQLHPLRELMQFLRGRISRNYCNITNLKLYTVTKVGTKKLIEDFIDNICQSLHYIAYTHSEPRHNEPQPLLEPVTIEEKIVFYSEMKHILGSTALCLSGGSTLGAYHGGVLLTMFNNNLLPKIISGSSIGACIASLVCTKTEEKYMSYAEKGVEFILDTKDKKHWLTSFYIRLRRFYQNGYILDISILRQCMKNHLGDITFLEAYNKTHRILNITVSPLDSNTVPRLLNYLTAPNVVIWSAVVASCCVPFVFESQELYTKSVDGFISPVFLQGVTFSDGSLAHDLPVNKLRKLFNVNNFIVSQVNPHLVPFLFHTVAKPIPLFGKVFNFLGNEFQLYITTVLVNLREFGILKGLRILNDLFVQTYTGDITIVPDISYQEYLQVLSNPSIEYVLKCTKISQKGAWKHISRLQGLCATEFKIDECLTYLRAVNISDV